MLDGYGNRLKRKHRPQSAGEVFYDMLDTVRATKPELASEFAPLISRSPGEIGIFLNKHYPVVGGWLHRSAATVWLDLQRVAYTA